MPQDEKFRSRLVIKKRCLMDIKHAEHDFPGRLDYRLRQSCDLNTSIVAAAPQAFQSRATWRPQLTPIDSAQADIKVSQNHNSVTNVRISRGSLTDNWVQSPRSGFLFSEQTEYNLIQYGRGANTS
ncbi:hypothetical protein PM082_017577 [Marasmius tenuissimus]|nr:hypothetical protein PM082_017577 [Marasmius tenuissimus]